MYFRKELHVQEILKWGGYLRGKWEEYFASHLSAAQKRDIYLHNYLWHLFSYEEQIYIDKEKCTVFFQHTGDAYVIENAASLTLADLPSGNEDVYVMDWNGKWTFMITHEREYGPYYFKFEG